MTEVPRPRLCHIAKWQHFDGYGFNLHAEKAKPGQYIGKVDPDSPAEKAGLTEGDKIVEVNGVNINQENHKQVVQRIKSIPHETRMLVVDALCEQYHKENNIIIKGTLPYVLHMSSENDIDEVDEEINTNLQTVNGHETVEDGSESPDEEQNHTPEENHTKKQSNNTPEESHTPERCPTPEPVGQDMHRIVVSREDSVLEHSRDSASTKSNRSSLSSEKQEVSGMENHVSKVDINVNNEESVSSGDTEVYVVNQIDEKESISSKTSDQESLSGSCSLGKEEIVPISSNYSVPSPTSDSVNSQTFQSTTSQIRSVVTESPNSLSSGSPRSTPSPTNYKNFDGLNLNMTAKEMRERIGSRKKKDPRKDDRMDFRKKYEIIQTL